MKFAALFVAVAGIAAVAQAAPIDSVTYTAVASSGRQGGATNQVRTNTFAATGTVRQINVTGTLTPAAGVTNTWSSQAMIFVTPPAGAQPFIIQPFTGRANLAADSVNTTPAGAFTALPVAVAANAGTWTFRFFESSWETLASNGTDATWNTITITLDDTAPALPARPEYVDGSIESTFTAIPVNVAVAATAGWNTVTFTPTSAATVDTLVLSATGTALSYANAAALTADVGNAGLPYNAVDSILVRVLPPGGTRTGWFAPFLGGAASSTSIPFAAIPFANSPNAPIPANTGTWTIEFGINLATGAPNFTPAFTSWINNLRVDLVSGQPPASAEEVTLLDGGTVTKTGTFTAAGELKWYKFTLPAGTVITRANLNALDLGMFGSSMTPETDACMTVYNSAGAAVATSFNTGPGSLPQISFGAGIRNFQGLPADIDPGVPFDCAAPGFAPPNNFRPDLGSLTAATTYYVVVTNGDDGAVFHTGLFNVTPTTEANTGDYSVMFRSWLTNGTAPFDTPFATSLGTLAGGPLTRTATMTGFKGFTWYALTIPTGADDITGKFLDIDTANTAAPLNDTNLALYSSAGAFLASNDDIGTSTTDPAAKNSALSFGMGGLTRDYSAVNALMPPGDGRDGPLPAGTYYLQVSPCCANYQTNRFWVINDYFTNPQPGDIAVHINHNYPITSCSTADIGVQGGVPGSDNLLDNNDFIVFIAYFFGPNPLADIGVQGGVPGSDGLYDNNDFIVFIGVFFTDSPVCLGNP